MLPGALNIELKPNGTNILLSMENLEEYIQLVTRFTLFDTINPQISAFREGINQVRKNLFNYIKIGFLLEGAKVFFSERNRRNVVWGEWFSLGYENAI